MSQQSPKTSGRCRQPEAHGSGERGEERIPGFVPVHNAGEDVVRVCAGADEEEDDKEEGLEVEEGGLEDCQYSAASQGFRLTILAV